MCSSKGFSLCVIIIKIVIVLIIIIVTDTDNISNIGIIIKLSRYWQYNHNNV